MESSSSLSKSSKDDSILLFCNIWTKSILDKSKNNNKSKRKLLLSFTISFHKCVSAFTESFFPVYEFLSGFNVNETLYDCCIKLIILFGYFLLL